MTSSSLKYALCIESIFPKINFEERIRLTLQNGYKAVEVWRVDETKRKFLLEAKKQGVRTVMLVGARNFVTRDSTTLEVCKEDLKRNLDIALELDCPNICLFAGSRNPALTFDEGRAAVIHFLEEASKILEGSGVTGIIESLSPAHHGNAFLLKMSDVISIVKEINRPEIKLQFDLFHTAMTDSNLEQLVRDHVDITAYYQAADAPTRDGPGTGIIDFKQILGFIKQSKFDGYFTWEITPKGDPSVALEQARSYQI
jgi:hydroxypyruvate isomerase